MLFDQAAWLKHFPQFFDAGQPSLKLFSSFLEPDRNLFITALIATMGSFYGGTHHFLPKDRAPARDGEEVAAQITSLVLPVWRHGLIDCSAAQILSGLFLVIGGRTEYIEFPPASVLKFKAICKGHRPAFYDIPKKPTDFPRLGWDKEAAQKKTAAIQKAAMIRVLQTLKEARLVNAKDKRGYTGNYGQA